MNNKGFTLVELLGVVVILAIVLGVSGVTITGVITNSKYKTLDALVDTASDFVSDQWRIKKIDPNTMTDAFKDVMGSYRLGVDNFVQINNNTHKTLIDEMGFSVEDVKKVNIKINSNGTSCVVVTELSLDSRLYNTKHWNKVDYSGGLVVIPNNDNNENYYSKHCDINEVNTLLSRYNG